MAKLLANALWFAHAAAGTEALLLGQALGLAPDALRQLLSDSAGGSSFMERHVGRLLDGDYLEEFPIDRVVEELRTVHSLAADAGTPTPVLSASADLHEQSLERFGPAMGELLGARLLEERAGTTLRRRAQPSGPQD
ncbi:NAD-binding protein [Curtobacterium sp. MCPF17_002]|uniref:NAD-binding protein n=1 Tax=Curtobacterium sp. MCPF17_002 TaxID=2175645 RepID=UPI0024DFFF3B|nr:NAD-binding protein [Curtobacterium sp. MCPF17_002]WIB79013.1 NAD-binding protein [Curtobacterium sp. MCPF17_002]